MWVKCDDAAVAQHFNNEGIRFDGRLTQIKVVSSGWIDAPAPSCSHDEHRARHEAGIWGWELGETYTLDNILRGFSIQSQQTNSKPVYVIAGGKKHAIVGFGLEVGHLQILIEE